MENNQEPEILVFTDDEGNDVNVQVLNYFYYNGDEYAVLTEVTDGAPACECPPDQPCECEPAEIFFMKVVPVDEENVEFQPVEDEDLADKLFEIISTDYDEDEDDGDQ